MRSREPHNQRGAAARRLNKQFRNNKKVYRRRYCDQFHLGSWRISPEEWKISQSSRGA